jgi:hypothetical protein
VPEYSVVEIPTDQENSMPLPEGVFAIRKQPATERIGWARVRSFWS